MKEQITNECNLAMLKGFLAGKDYESLAKENNLSGKSSAYQCVTSDITIKGEMITAQWRIRIELMDA